MEDETDEGSRSVSINAKKAKSAVKKECGKVKIRSVQQKRDDGLYFFKITFTGKSFWGEAKVNAAKKVVPKNVKIRNGSAD